MYYELAMLVTESRQKVLAKPNMSVEAVGNVTYTTSSLYQGTVAVAEWQFDVIKMTMQIIIRSIPAKRRWLGRGWWDSGVSRALKLPLRRWSDCGPCRAKGAYGLGG